ncbi:uncharacterized protein LOC124448625 isoform X1 [Xenia sp. Carnegie-2017]|uniref:uncharacterized protein LOC124448625 isoform X1 n=1 Tax=Xenia sp. Carnegie-2017 TaxID=2897299 RepID=UPI001F047519|nr:uncharacterized protein LOC124448625 isoform X1 [Xenia sp. Carnegie-2017]
MASITIERITGFLIVAFKRGAKAAVGAAVGAAVVAAFTGAVTQAVEAVVATAISAAIAAGIVSAVSGSVTQLTTQLVQKSIEKCLDEAVKDVISSHGIKDISKPKAVIASDEVLNELANATFEAVNPHLWAFKDPSFLKIAKLIRALRAVQKGERPESEDVGDDDCVEEKRRYFDGRMVEEFVFFTVFGSNDCQEGDEVYSMSVQQKKLESLIQDPFGGKLVNLFLQELSESCVEPVHEIKIVFLFCQETKRLKMKNLKSRRNR